MSQAQPGVGRIRPWVVVAALSCAPVLAGVVAQRDRAWVPNGDEAAVAWLTYDVAHGQPTLVGMPSTISLGGSRTQAYHLGPLLFWALAPLATLWRWSSTGYLLSAALVNAASIVLLVWFTRRRVGNAAAIVALALLPFMLGSLGRLSLASITNPTIAILPTACFVVLAWSIACGDALALPFAAFAGSFAVQSHFVYAPLVGGLTVWALAGFVLTRRAERAAGTTTSARRPVVAAAIVVMVAWSAPLVDQATRDPGNLVAVVRAARESSQPTASTAGTYALSRRVFGGVPLWLDQHPYYGGAFRAPNVLVTFTAIACIAALGVLAYWLRGRDRTLQRMTLTALIGALLSMWTMSTMPRAFGFFPALYTARHFWVTGWFAWATLLVVAYRRGLRRPAAKRAAVAAAGVVLGTGVVVATFAIGAPAPWPSKSTFTAVRALASETRRELPRDRPYLVSGVTSGFSGVQFGVAFDLQRHGYDIRVPRDDPYLGRNHGIGTETPPARLLVVSGESALDALPGLRRVAVFEADPRGRHVTALEARMLEVLHARPPRLTAAGRALVREAPRDENSVLLRRMTTPGADLRPFLRTGAVQVMAKFDLLDVDPGAVDLGDELVDLRTLRWAAYVSDTVEPRRG
jgi:hypothetical protein